MITGSIPVEEYQIRKAGRPVSRSIINTPTTQRGKPPIEECTNVPRPRGRPRHDSTQPSKNVTLI